MLMQDVFVLDTTNNCFVWVGNKASANEKKNGFAYAHVSGRIISTTNFVCFSFFFMVHSSCACGSCCYCNVVSINWWSVPLRVCCRTTWWRRRILCDQSPSSWKEGKTSSSCRRWLPKTLCRNFSLFCFFSYAVSSALPAAVSKLGM